MNEHIASVADGDTTTPVEIPIKGHTISERSVHIPPGLYAAVVKSAAWKAKAGGKFGRNFYVEATTSAPGDYANATLRKWIPAPTGEAEDTGVKMLGDLLVSAFSALGKADQLVQQERARLTPGGLVGKTIYLRVADEEITRKDGTGTGRMGSAISGFASKEQFDAAPGPERPVAGQGAGAGSQATGQGSTLDLLGGATGNGTATGKPTGSQSAQSSAIDKALGF